VPDPTVRSFSGTKSAAVICPRAVDFKGVEAVSVDELSKAPKALTDIKGALFVRVPANKAPSASGNVKVRLAVKFAADNVAVLDPVPVILIGCVKVGSLPTWHIA
jgi:hypothetical protein